MATVDHEIHSKHTAAITKSHERNPQSQDFSLGGHSLWNRMGRMAREHFASENRFVETVSTCQ